MLYVSLKNMSCLINKMTFKISLIKIIILLLLFTKWVLELKTESCACLSYSMLPPALVLQVWTRHRLRPQDLLNSLMLSSNDFPIFIFIFYHGYLFVLLLVYRSFFNLQFDIPNEIIKAFVKHLKVSVCNLKLSFV